MLDKRTLGKESVEHPAHYDGPHECIEVMEALIEEGYCAVVCKGFEEAKETIDWYLRGAR